MLSVHVFRERLSVCVCASFPFGFEGGGGGFIVLVADNWLSIKFSHSFIFNGFGRNILVEFHNIYLAYS